MSAPDRVPTRTLGRRFTDALARRLPWGHERIYFSLWIMSRSVAPGVDQVIPYLTLYVEFESFGAALRVLRLPGAKLAELYDIHDEEWLEYPGAEQ